MLQVVSSSASCLRVASGALTVQVLNKHGLFIDGFDQNMIDHYAVQVVQVVRNLPFWLRPWRSVSNVIGDCKFWELLGCCMDEHDLVFFLFLHDEFMKAIPIVFVRLRTARIETFKRDEIDVIEFIFEQMSLESSCLLSA